MHTSDENGQQHIEIGLWTIGDEFFLQTSAWWSEIVISQFYGFFDVKQKRKNMLYKMYDRSEDKMVYQ